MDALYIIDSKTHEILLTKEFRSNESNLKFQIFLMEMDNLLLSEKSPFVQIQDSFFIYLQANISTFSDSNSNKHALMFLAIVSEDHLVNSVYKILQNINSALLQAFDYTLTSDLIRDNFVEIMLMIDQYLISGVPTINEVNALSGLISPYNLKDKLTEKFIGKAKEYDTRTLMNYVRETQTTYDNFKYQNENIKSNTYEILFHFTDYVELSCDKSFNQLNKSVFSEIEVFSQIPNNIELNLLLNIPFNVLDFNVDETVLTKKKEIIKKKNMDCLVRHGNYIISQFIPILTNQIPLPFKITVSSTQTNSYYNLNIQIEPEPVRDTCHSLEDIQVKLFFPDNFNNSNLSVNTGDFEMKQFIKAAKAVNVSAKEAIWTISHLEKNSTATLKGQLVIDSETGVNTSTTCVLLFSCLIDKFSVTGGAITKGTIMKNTKNLNISKKGRNFTKIKSLEIVF